MSNDGLTPELEQLFSAACDETLTDIQQAELEAALSDSLQLQDVYLDFCRFHADMRHHAQSIRSVQSAIDVAIFQPIANEDKDQTVLPSSSLETGPAGKTTDWRKYPLRFGLLIAALTLVVWVGFWALFVRNIGLSDPPVANQDEERFDRTVAVLVAEEDADWKGFVPAVDANIVCGQRLVLRSGMVELRYRTGAQVVVEGPAEFWVGGKQAGSKPISYSQHRKSINLLYVAYGKAVARCETRRSKGFQVITPNALVTDLGTEFGVVVQQNGAAEVVVVSGVVTVAPNVSETGKIHGDRPQKPIRLAKGQAASVGTVAGEIVRRKQVDVQFVRSAQRRLAKFSSVDGFVAYHDFGATTGSQSTGNITTHQFADAASADLHNTTPLDTSLKSLIRHSDGTDAGVDFQVSGANGMDPRNSGQYSPPVTGSDAAALFNLPGLNLNNGSLIEGGISGSGSTTLTLTGLDPNKLYDLALYGDRTRVRSGGVERFKLGGADSATNSSSRNGVNSLIVNDFTTNLQTSNNYLRGNVVRWTDIDPGSDGVITIDVDPEISGESNIAYLSAMRLEEQHQRH